MMGRKIYIVGAVVGAGFLVGGLFTVFVDITVAPVPQTFEAELPKQRGYFPKPPRSFTGGQEYRDLLRGQR